MCVDHMDRAVERKRAKQAACAPMCSARPLPPAALLRLCYVTHARLVQRFRCWLQVSLRYQGTAVWSRELHCIGKDGAARAVRPVHPSMKKGK